MYIYCKNHSIWILFSLSSSVSLWPAGVVKDTFDHTESLRGLQPDFDLCSPARWRQPHHGTAGHTVSQNSAAATPTQLNGDWDKSQHKTSTHFEPQLMLKSSALTKMALHPLFVLATRQPSVVAMGTWNCFPSNSRGPATPTGTGMYPMTFSQQVPSTYRPRT